VSRKLSRNVYGLWFCQGVIKKEFNPQILLWLDSQDETALYMSVLMIGELQKGISRLPDGPRNLELQARVSNNVGTRFEGRFLSIDGEVAATLGRLLGAAERRGKKLPVMEGLIGATAIPHHLTVVARNTRDLERCQAKVFNPWKG
jgi:toxin FitB